MLSKHLKIFGRVQGVWYRKSFADEAHKNNILGWVTNCPDGSVEAVIQGDDAQVLKQIEWAKKGPPLAKVSNVVINDFDEGVEFAAFEIRR
ncbi:MAG: acylphosphatase [Bdellovibrio sp.]